MIFLLSAFFKQCFPGIGLELLFLTKAPSLSLPKVLGDAKLLAVAQGKWMEYPKAFLIGTLAKGNSLSSCFDQPKTLDVVCKLEPIRAVITGPVPHTSHPLRAALALIVTLNALVVNYLFTPCTCGVWFFFSCNFVYAFRIFWYLYRGWWFLPEWLPLLVGLPYWWTQNLQWFLLFIGT